MSWPPYPLYESSGVEWLDQIPVGWEMQKLRRVCPLTTGWTPPSGDDASYHGDNPWANISDLGPRVLQAPQRSISDEAVLKSRIPLSPKGSLLFSFKLSIGQVSFAGQDMFTNEAIATFRQSEQLDLAFAYYLFPFALVQNANENIYGAKLLNQELMYAARIPLPPVDEQRRIAAFLDEETVKIDGLIAKQEQLIATLREDRIATIAQVVSKGLDPDVDLKDSGIEWLGEIRASWPVSALKRHFSVVLGKMLQREPRAEGDCLQPYLRAAHVPPTGFTTDDAKQMWFSPIERLQLDLRRGDVVVVEGGMGGYGRCDMIPEDLPGWGFEKSINRLRARHRSSGAFAKYVLQTARELGFIEAICSVSTMPHLTAEKLGDLLIPVPPIHQQHEIVRFLDERGRKIDALTAKANQVIDTLGEYRSALITDAVTGKIDVRGVA